MAEYKLFDKVLHRAVLSKPLALNATLDLELLLSGKKLEDVSQSMHIFVCGLARAGTTILMSEIYRTGKVASLTYRDMPFVMAPNFWSSISRGREKDAVLAERKHGDGIKVGFDSPEALDEVFWRATCEKDYVLEDALIPHDVSNDVLRKFRLYVAAILKSRNRDRYISKNNNNALRLPAIRKAFPNSIILVPFRDPVQHAISLHKQHERFSGEQGGDAFTEQYMSWLGHHEFGKSHKRYKFSDAAALHTNPDTLNYWLENWINEYRFLIEVSQTLKSPAVFVSYELLCAQSESVWQALGSVADFPADTVPEFRESRSKPEQVVDAGLLESAGLVYEQLTGLCKKSLSLP